MRSFSALQPNLRSPHEDEREMAERAIGLISRKRTASAPVFSRSPSKRWLVYERRSLPCIIDTENDTEELVGWEQSQFMERPNFGPMDTLWHPHGDMAAFQLGIGKRDTAVWIWRPGKQVVLLDTEAFLPLLGGEIAPWAGTDCKSISWKGRDLLVDYTYEIPKGEDAEVWTARAQWNPETAQLRILRKAPSSW
jgi:hypothetical protein